MENRRLSDHFTLYDLTKTNRVEFIEKNREVEGEQVAKLQRVADMLEDVRVIIDATIVVLSGYRCHDLNVVVGSSDRSQHVYCEAVDFTVKGIALENAYRLLRRAAQEGRINFGQLILEKAKRAYGLSEWIHLSLGFPYREKERCGQVLTMNDGKYHLVETIKNV